MPELPEVETAKNGIQPHIQDQTITQIIVRQKQLRWPIPDDIQDMCHQRVEHVERRGKYILISTATGTAILHLGMSGNLRIVETSPPEKHDHIDFIFEHGKILRLRDPRRFGAVLWTKENPLEHKLLSTLGPEPLDDIFTAEYLYTQSRGRKTTIKTFIMNSHIVVGVGNIYASESLFMAGIHPKRAAGNISFARYEKLVDAIKIVLKKAIQQGGTTLKDFVREDGQTGYFQLKLHVYGKTGKPCTQCSTPIKQITLGQRSTFYCGKCQK